MARWRGGALPFMLKPIPVPKSGPFACEDIIRPALIAQPGGTVRAQPVIYRCKGLVVIDNTPFVEGPNWDARYENGWHSDEIWAVTHEATGTGVCSWEGAMPAVAAAQVLLALPVDWTGDGDSVRRDVKKDPRIMGAISALKSGHMVMVEREPRRGEGV
jgi:hypothetical protein